MTTHRSASAGIDRDSPEAVYRLVARLLETQTSLYGQLDALAERQREMIDADDADRLLGLLAERQAIVDRVSMVNREMEPARAAWERALERVRPEWRADVARRLTALSSLAARVAERDEQDRQRLVERRREVASELASLTTARRATAAYGRPASEGPGPARYQDREA